MASWNPLALLKPKAPRASGAAGSPTFDPTATDRPQAIPAYRDHLIDLFDLRLNSDSPALLESLFRNDPDVGASVNAFLTLADSEPHVSIRDITGAYVPEAYEVWHQMVNLLGMPADLTQGYLRKPSLRAICEQQRYMLLLRGACAAELVMDKSFIPTEIRTVDAGSLIWFEKTPGQFKPMQKQRGGGADISLDLPTFFHGYFRQSPTNLYPYSPFVGAITTIAARQQVVNDLYRILKVTGYPRLDITVVEEVLKNAAPASIKSDASKVRTWVNERITDIRNTFSAMNPEDAFVHTDASSVKLVGDKGSGVGINMDSVINVLNAQNQAALRTMATIIGRGESGVNTSTVEARIFTLNADALNAPIGDLLSKVFTTAFQILGFPVFVTVEFPPSELRPTTELEAQLMVRQARLLEALSLGLVTDDEVHMKLYGRLPPPGSPKLMGTGFQKALAPSTDPTKGPSDQPNSIARDATPSGPKNPDKSKAVKK